MKVKLLGNGLLSYFCVLPNQEVRPLHKVLLLASTVFIVHRLSRTGKDSESLLFG